MGEYVDDGRTFSKLCMCQCVVFSQESSQNSDGLLIFFKYIILLWSTQSNLDFSVKTNATERCESEINQRNANRNEGIIIFELSILSLSYVFNRFIIALHCHNLMTTRCGVPSDR